MTNRRSGGLKAQGYKLKRSHRRFCKLKLQVVEQFKDDGDERAIARWTPPENGEQRSQW